MRSIIPVIAVLIAAQRADAESLAADAVPSVDVGPAAEPAGDPPKAKPSKRRGKKKGGALPRLDPSREEKEFERKLALAQSLQTPERCGAAYAMLLDLEKLQPNHPDVLWGLGECGATTAGYPELGVEVQRQRLLDAKAAYERYITVEQRPQFLPNGGEGRRDIARIRVGNINVALSGFTSPAPAVALAAPAAPAAAPPPATPPMAAPPVATVPPAPTPPPVDCGAERDAALLHGQALVHEGDYRSAVDTLSALPAQCLEDVDLIEHVIVWKAAIADCVGVPMLYAPIMERCTSPEVHEAVVTCAKQLRQPALLVVAFERQVAYAESPDPDALLVLADLHEAGGQRDRAQSDVERFLAITAQRPGMDAARERASARLAALRLPVKPAEPPARCSVRPRAVQVGDRWVILTPLPTGAICAE